MEKREKSSKAGGIKEKRDESERKNEREEKDKRDRKNK